jgi:hypothetical protein
VSQNQGTGYVYPRNIVIKKKGKEETENRTEDQGHSGNKHGLKENSVKGGDFLKIFYLEKVKIIAKSGKSPGNVRPGKIPPDK